MNDFGKWEPHDVLLQRRPRPTLLCVVPGCFVHVNSYFPKNIIGFIPYILIWAFSFFAWYFVSDSILGFVVRIYWALLFLFNEYVGERVCVICFPAPDVYALDACSWSILIAFLTVFFSISASIGNLDKVKFMFSQGRIFICVFFSGTQSSPCVLLI